MEELSVTTVPLGDNVDGIQFANIYRVFFVAIHQLRKKICYPEKESASDDW